jgi:hypothetical protein
MTATTPSSLGIYKDSRPDLYFRFSVFPWHAHLFLALNKVVGFQFRTRQDPESPVLVLFQFTCDPARLATLIQRYLEAGFPFSLANFNLKDEADTN